MDFRIGNWWKTGALLLSASVLIPRGWSQDISSLNFSTLQDEPLEWEWDTTQDGCQTHFRASSCIYEVFCRGYFDDDKIYQNNPFKNTHINRDIYVYDDDQVPSISRFCPEISHHNQRFGEVHVKLKQSALRKNYVQTIDFSDSNSYILQNNPLFTAITTQLDLSDNELSFLRIVTMPVLKKLKLSENSYLEAFLYNEHELHYLQEIDYSHNTISGISVNKDKYIFKELKTIDLSYNYLVSIESGVFGSFPNLESLDLSHNFIDALDILTFEGVKKLINLNMKHNRLSQLDSSLIRFSKLKTLVLSENKLQTIKLSDYEKLQNLEYLDLSSNAISELETYTFSNLTALKTLNLRDNVLENINKDIFANLTKLQKVNLSKNYFRVLPKDVFKDKHISEFSITQNKLEGALVQGTFEGMWSVTELNLSFQLITSVEDYAFYGASSLETLLLNDNSINSLGNFSFRNLRNLATLDLSNNKLSNIDFMKDELTSLESLFLKNNQLFQVNSDYFDGLNVLRFLDLSQNNITHLETRCFWSLRRLNHFLISDNPMSGVLEESAFFGLTSLPNLDISGTLLTAVKNGSFDGMSQLKELNLSHSKIIELQYNAFINTGMIQIIDLSYNELKHFNVNATELTTLVSLILNNNALTAVSSEYFKEVPRLSKIILSYNHIQSIDDGAFAYQIDLRYLDLSYNKKLKFNISQLENVSNFEGLYLSGIESNINFEFVHEMALSYLVMSQSYIRNITYLALKNLKELDELVLSKNNIAKVEINNFKGVKQLKKLDLSCNEITYIQPGAFKDNSLLHFLNISHNLLKAVNYGIFRGLSYLDTIDMSYNEIRDLQSERFYELNSLSNLIADHNKISSVSANEFYGTNLKRLSIGGNPIPCDILVNLKKNNHPFIFTAIRLEENSDFENVDGVTCNVRGTILKTKHDSETFLPNDRILLDIKEILYNISSFKVTDKISVVEKTNDTNILFDVGEKIASGNEKIQEGNIILQKNIQETKNTNLLLEKVLKVLSAGNTVKTIEPIPAPKGNVSAENLVPYINNVKKQLEDTIAAERQNIFTDLEDKLKQNLLLDLENKMKQINDALEAKINKLNVQVSASKDNNVSHFASGVHEAYSANEGSDTKSFVFIEVCVGLMLILMVLFILYKFYNSGIFIPSRHSASTRQLSDAIDNSTL